ncbi:hypothetical protein [Haloarcula onubensis]|uniref:Uncharacterized protein n=1 Tax=Haloarcula onubensis TaxID=2950539 RepID=A0ABU2FMV9_9EURY|nr:hypothetical protein [Halomicroarcula sp. S3CR25-11]MDS0282084.1 hypothetical protein [Halomicroarcula sp. S3CR25-11]
MADPHCLCLTPTMVEAVRDDAVARAHQRLGDAGRPGGPERAAVASLADRLAVRLLVLTVASCPRHGSTPCRPDGDRGGAGVADRRASGAVDR